MDVRAAGSEGRLTPEPRMTDWPAGRASPEVAAYSTLPRAKASLDGRLTRIYLGLGLPALAIPFQPFAAGCQSRCRGGSPAATAPMAK